jgi:plastocyanin
MSSSFVGKRTNLVIAFLLTAAAFACGGGGSTSDGMTGPVPPPPPDPGTNASTTALTVTNNKFTPAHDSVAVGSTLTWTWNTCSSDVYGDNTCVSHSVQFDDGSASSSIKDSGSFSRAFATAGTYTYHCAVHGSAMTGTVLVK